MTYPSVSSGGTAQSGGFGLNISILNIGRPSHGFSVGVHSRSLLVERSSTRSMPRVLSIRFSTANRCVGTVTA